MVLLIILTSLFGYSLMISILMYGEKGIGSGNKLSIMNNFGKGGGSSTTTVVQSPASAGASKEAVEAWVQSLPQIFETQLKYAPKEAQQQLELIQQYATPLGMAARDANEALYPGTAALQETMAGQALQGMTATEMPDWMRRQYLSDYRANLGTNAASPIGADYVSRGMQQQLYNQQSKYRDLGLALTGRQQLASPASPATTNYMGTFTPGNVMNYLGANRTTSSTTSTSGGGGLFGSLFG